MHPSFPADPWRSQVVEGMDVVKAIEAVGSSSGSTSKRVEIVDSGEIPLGA